MICKNCGKEIQDGVAFCPSCGAKVDEVPVNNPNVVPALEKPKKKHKGLIIFCSIVGVLLLSIVIFSIFDEESESITNNSSVSVEIENESKENDEILDDEIKEKIYSVLNNTPAIEGYNTSVGNALGTIFKDYTVSFKKFGGKTSYIVTVSGKYLPNPEVPQAVEEGEVTYGVNIESGYCEIRNDIYGIENVIKVYVVNYLG